MATKQEETLPLSGRAVIAIDGECGLPFRVRLHAKGASSPAFQDGYTALQWVVVHA